MAHHRSHDGPQDIAQTVSKNRFCAACGAELDSGGQFCARCGRAAAGNAARPGLAAAGRATGPVAAAVFLMFLGIGGAGIYAAFSEQGPRQRAVPGSPTAAAPPAGDSAEALPPGHPQIAIPPEIVKVLDDLTATAEASPDDIEAWQRLARARYRAGLLDRSYFARAAEALDHVLELEPDNPEAVRTYANIAYDSGRYAEAEQRFTRYLELDPTDPGAKTDMASAILFQGRKEEATAKYREIIEKHPEFVQAHINLGIALHAEGRKEESLESLRRGRSLTTDAQQLERIDQIIATAEGRTPPARTPAAAQAAMPSPPARISSNASSEFQKNADKLFTGHRIVGPRVTRIEWAGDAEADVKLENFPMDKMPPVMRNKFKSNMNESLTTLARAHGVDADVNVELVNADDGAVMDMLDGKEWVGAFDEEAYE